MSSLNAEVDRGARAARIMADPLVQEAFQSVEQAIHEQWAASPVRDVEGQVALRHMLNQLRDLRAVFEVAIADGNAAANELKRRTSKVLSPREWMNR